MKYDVVGQHSAPKLNILRDVVIKLTGQRTSIWCDLLKIMVQAEVFTSSGRIDMMVAAGEWIYVIEFKLNKTADQAMKQIENKDYAMKYRKDGKRIMLLGVNFDSEAGNITDWLKEEYHR